MAKKSIYMKHVSRTCTEVMKLVKERFIRENNNENDNETEEKL